jgi:hypothetical protein
MEDFIRDSFKATIAFGLLAIALLVIAALVSGSWESVTFGLLACAAAYVSQMLGTFHAGANLKTPDGSSKPGLLVAALSLQLLSAVLWLFGLFNLT